MEGKSSKPYSLPAGVKFPCDSGKSYHFWMSAHFTRQLKKKGYSDKVAAAAVFGSNFGYAVSKTVRSARFSPTEIGITMDLVLASAGTRYGTRSNGDQAKISLSKAFIRALQSAGSGQSVAIDARNEAGIIAKMQEVKTFSDNLKFGSIFSDFEKMADKTRAKSQDIFHFEDARPADTKGLPGRIFYF